MPAGQEGKPLKGGSEWKEGGNPQGYGIKGSKQKAQLSKDPEGGRTPAVGLTRAAAAGAWDAGAEAGEEVKSEGEKGPVNGYVQE